MERERFGLEFEAFMILLAVLVIVLGLTYIKLKDTQERLEALEKESTKKTETLSKQQEQLDSIDTNIEELWQNAEKANNEIGRLNNDLNGVRQVQRNSNSAITRLRKQTEELEKKLEEGLEMKRQQLERQMAARSTPSGTWSAIGGVFELTAYEWTGNPCANGEYPIPDYTVASNWFPIGTRIYIEGIGERVVTDTGGMSNNVIDIYMGDPETCIQFGRQTAQVYVIED